MKNNVTQEELYEIISALSSNSARGIGQAGRAEKMLTLLGGEMVLELWRQGYRDWQISKMMNVSLFTVQDYLAHNSIDYKSRSLPIDDKLYSLSASTTLFDGADYLMLHMYLYDITLKDLSTKLFGIIDPFTLQRITEGRLIPTAMQARTISNVLHLDINIWKETSKDIKNIFYKKMLLHNTPDEWANAQDDFSITYKKFNVRYVFAYARVFRNNTSDLDLARELRVTPAQLTDLEQCEYVPTLKQAERIVEVLGLTDIADVYRCKLLPAGYRTMFRQHIKAEQAALAKDGTTLKDNLKELICATALDNLAQVERGCTYANKKAANTAAGSTT